ncbi:HNH endonuclease signature motif containing protein [Allobranchiibius sp. GilTou73]|uniref:HNH endonuclease signature motif containing protein n=1 Tax=Allobranchiibius sp. GilTou73 TaxID=2904523 RepID=UPI001F2A483A|nr:HNH endonuclease signature motif containing protein [Allobranchiibius sp. GilTou73]UIJ33780.1 HNH endonuclease [Allobranchiibius sp. GilTou73]
MAQSTTDTHRPAAPGTGARLVAPLNEFTNGLDEWPGALWQLDEAALGDVVGGMLRIATQAENVAALATTDALRRGTVANSTATGAPAWVARQAAGVDPVVVRRVGAVGVECADPRNQVVVDALATGSASVPVAAVALREVPHVLPQLPSADRDELLGRYLSLSDHGPRALRELTTRILGEYAPQRLVRDEERQQECESVFWADLPSGLTRFVAELSGGDAAVVKHALRALSAPAPQPCATDTDDPCDAPNIGPLLQTGTSAPGRDTRTPAKRRADALVRLIDTAAGVLDGTSSRPVGEFGGTAKILVTLDYATLYEGLREAGRLSEHSSDDGGFAPTYLPGIGRTTDGDYLNAGTLRRMACDADLIPAVLGTESEPLDVGRAKRLFTGGLRTAIIHRDRHCTFPGCDRPPDWCDAHHVRPWWAGGETDLGNAALLCARHHTIVHRDLLTATVTETGVTWDLTPGLMPTRPGGRVGTERSTDPPVPPRS